MNNKHFLIILSCVLLAACGYKGDLYLPKENDKARFGVIQTGIDFRKPDAVKRKQNQIETQAASAVKEME
ncbi:LPS translocon maturation chaperone LptM [Neisseriaceae bacterium B1]